MDIASSSISGGNQNLPLNKSASSYQGQAAAKQVAALSQLLPVGEIASASNSILTGTGTLNLPASWQALLAGLDTVLPDDVLAKLWSNIDVLQGLRQGSTAGLQTLREQLFSALEKLIVNDPRLSRLREFIGALQSRLSRGAGQALVNQGAKGKGLASGLSKDALGVLITGDVKTGLATLGKLPSNVVRDVLAQLVEVEQQRLSTHSGIKSIRDSIEIFDRFQEEAWLMRLQPAQQGNEVESMFLFFYEQLIHRVHAQWQDVDDAGRKTGGDDMTFSFLLPRLGAVKARLQYQAPSVQITFRVKTEDAQLALEKNISQLSELLKHLDGEAIKPLIRVSLDQSMMLPIALFSSVDAQA